jgi:hypothetical protein
MYKMSIARLAMVAVICIAMPALASSQEASEAKPRMIPIDKFDYFDDGKVMACSKLTPEGKLVGKIYYYHDGKIRKVERYDRDENKIEEANYDESGKLDDNVDGWAAKGWTYKDGKLRAESTYGEDGHLTERKIYNEEGDLVDRQYVGDGVIDPSEEYNRGSVVTAETDQFFDKYGRQTGSVTTEVDDPDDM